MKDVHIDVRTVENPRLEGRAFDRHHRRGCNFPICSAEHDPAADTDRLLRAGIPGLVAGAMSMAAGEYVAVSSQSDTEQADIARARRELTETPDLELDELTSIYVGRGVAPDIARQVALQLMEKDALGARARDELGISEISTAGPLQAAFRSPQLNPRK